MKAWLNFLILLILLQFILSTPFQEQLMYYASYLKSLRSENNVLDAIEKNIMKVVNNTLNDEKVYISQNCSDSVSQAYINGTYTSFFINKLLQDSSKNKNDVGSYNDCLTNLHGLISFNGKEALNNLTYLVLSIELIGHDQSNITSTEYEANLYTVGLCMVTGCNDFEYLQIILGINHQMNNAFILKNAKTKKIYNMNEYHSREFQGIYIVFIFPLLIVALQVVFVLFPRLPMTIFKFLFRVKHEPKILTPGQDLTSGDKEKEKGDATNEVKKTKTVDYTSDYWTSDKTSINKNELFKFRSSFNLTENGEELFSIHSTVSNYNNESGLTYIKGMRGFAMIFLLFGFVFFNLYAAPIKIYGEYTFINLMKNYLYGILFVGLRFSPRILFSCSGFCLVYKYLCFLDDFLEAEIDRKINMEIVATNPKLKEVYGNANDKGESTVVAKETLEENANGLDNSSALIEKDPSEISYSAVSKFVIYQIHKYLILILVIFAFKFSLFYFVFLIKEIGPVWVYFKVYIMANTASTFFDLFGHIFLFLNFGLSEERKDCMLNIFWMVFNEISFFLLTIVLIFFCYKNKIKFDTIVICAIILLTTGRLFLVCFSSNMHSTLYYYLFDYGKFFINPLYNYPYYLIGVLFGLLNYTVQKGISYHDAIRQEKPYLITAIAVVRYFKSRSKVCLYSVGIFFIVIGILFSIVQPLFFSITGKGGDKHLKYFFTDTTMNFLYLIDIDCVVWIFHFIAFAFYIKGENLVNIFLSNNFWMIFNRLYFSVILLINPVILYIFYQSETRIKLELFNVFFYSVIVGFILIFMATFEYIFFELPFKRIIKLFTNRESTAKETKGKEEDTHTKDFSSNSN